MKINKRNSERKLVNDLLIKIKPLDPQVWFRYWSGTECSLRDLSLGGLGVYCRENMPAGTRISIDILLTHRVDPVKIFGKVVWSCAAENSYRSGISFSWWKSEEDKTLVSRYLEPLPDIA